MPIRRALVLLTAVLLSLAASADAADRPRLEVDDAEPPKTLNGLPLLYATGFEDSKDAGRWKTTDAAAWEVQQQGDNHVDALIKKASNYKPKVRSPLNQAILRSVTVGDCVLDVRLQSTEPDYAHRSLCLFFGYQDPEHFYYVHFGKKTDDHANQIFIVDGSPRTKISTKTTPGTDWDDEWHHARVVRDVGTGSIQVYFDDMETPVMVAQDKTFQWGRVGIGSFDDRGNFDLVRVYGEAAEATK